MHKKEKVLSTAEQEAAALKDYLGLIAPSVINFRVHSEYFIIGNTYRSVWAIRGYPTKVSADSSGLALLSQLGEKDGVTIRTYVNKLTEHEQQQIFEAANRRNRMKTKDLKVTTATQAQQNMQDIQDMILRSYNRKEPFVKCSIYIEVIADSLEDLQVKQSNLRTLLNQKKILVDKLYLQQKQGFLSVMPTGRNLFGSQFERVLPVSSVANLFPYSYSGKTDEHGFYLGRDENGSNIIADFDLRTIDKTNGHILILGNSGEGKSYLMKLVILNLRIAGKKIFILDPDDEFGDLVRKMGGSYLDMTAAEFCINPLEPRLWTVKENEQNVPENENIPTPEAFKKGTVLTQHIAYLRDFFRIYRNFSESELDVIEIMLEEVYKRAHITDTTDFSQLRPEQYPILSDLHHLISDKLISYEEDYQEAVKIGHPILYTRELLQSVALGLRNICVGSISRYFNNFTNVPNADFIDFSVKGVLQTNENLKNAMFLNIFSYMSHKFLTEGDCELIVDELHEFVKNKLAIQYINSFMKRGRKRNSGVMIASQNPEDLLRAEVIDYTKPLLSIPTHSFLFFPGSNCSPAEYQHALNVHPHEFELISLPNMGHCLFKCGNERYHLHVIAPSHKRALIGDSGGKGAA